MVDVWPSKMDWSGVGDRKFGLIYVRYISNSVHFLHKIAIDLK